MRRQKQKPVEFETGEPDLKSWLTDFTAYIEATQYGGKAELPQDFASGFAKVQTLEKGFTYRLVDYTLNSNFIYKAEASGNFFLILYFYQYSNLKYLYFKADDQVVVDSNETNFSSLLMTSSKVPQELQVSEGAKVRGLTIQLTEEWLQEKISHVETAGYQLLQGTKVFQSLLYPKAKKLLNEIFDKTMNEKIAPMLYINNRVARLLEGFFEQVLKNEVFSNISGSSQKDIDSLLRVERYLAENYAGAFPGVEKLARMAFISPTKLKRIFKQAYGSPLFEYFQRNRMHKAKEYLSTGKYSVAEVAMRLGYQNLSNFSAAFKKEIGCLPKDYLKKES